MIQTGPKAGRYAVIAAILVILLLTAATVRPVSVVRDNGDSSIVWLWAWQECRVNFINSITHHPVELRFAAPRTFSGFSAKTDAGTEEYYTAGGYAWNDQLALERTKTLNYCSEVGIDVTLGGKVFHEEGGCITLTLLWPPGE